MATVTSKNREEFNSKEMAKRTPSKEAKEHTYHHPTKGGGDIHAYQTGHKVRTSDNELGTISHIMHGEGIYPHVYRVSSLKDPNMRLEKGNYIPHTRLMPAEQDELTQK